MKGLYTGGQIVSHAITKVRDTALPGPTKITPFYANSLCVRSNLYMFHCEYVSTVCTFLPSPCIYPLRVYFSLCVSPWRVNSTERALRCTSSGERFIVCIPSMPKVHPKITRSLIECDEEQQVGNRIREWCLGKSKYCATTYGGVFRI